MWWWNILILSFTCFHTGVVATEPPLYLSPFVKNGQLQKAKEASRVEWAKFLNVTSYSGYVTVDEKYNSNYFFWYFPLNEVKTYRTPWIIWLQGGPGGSSLVGLFTEIGPYEYTDKATKLIRREHAWTNDFSMVFIDNPVGAGYSFTDNEEGYARDMQTYANHLYTCIEQLVLIYPELQTAPLYIAGESYAGHYVPAFGREILRRKTSSEKGINLQGLIMGNPLLDRASLYNYSSVYYNWGLIDNTGVAALQPLQDAFIKAIRSNDYNTSDDLYFRIKSTLSEITKIPNYFNMLSDPKSRPVSYNGEDFTNAIHVGDKSFEYINIKVQRYLKAEDLAHIQPIMEELLEHYNVLIYCGQLDLVAPCVPNAEARRRDWHWSGKEQFMAAPRQAWFYNETLAGYVKSGGRLTEVLVRGSGHMVPIDKPAQTRQLINHFITHSHLDLESYDIDTDDVKIHTQQIIDTTTEISVETGANKESIGMKPMMIVSICINALLIIVIVGLIFYYRSIIKRKFSFTYSEMSTGDDILTLS